MCDKDNMQVQVCIHTLANKIKRQTDSPNYNN